MCKNHKNEQVFTPFFWKAAILTRGIFVLYNWLVRQRRCTVPVFNKTERRANVRFGTNEICHKMYLYFISYDDRGAPSFTKFASSLKISLADLLSYRGRKKFDKAYRECCEIRRDYLIDRALDRRFDPSFVKFLLGEETDPADGEFRLSVEVSE